MLQIRLLLLTITVLLLGGCNQDNRTPNLSKINHSLTLISKTKLDVPEPSGLAFSPFTGTLFTVSDETSKIYELDSNGQTIGIFETNGNDLEGIAMVSDTSAAVVYERLREIEIIDLRGGSLIRVKLEIEGELNNGLEGIAFDSLEKRYFVLNEKIPRMMIVLDDSLNEIRRTTIKFADDLSGIFCEPQNKELWIISDESQSITRCDYNLKILEKFQVDIPQIEGIAMDIKNGRLFLISDRTQFLYTYQIN
ncbi:MAG: SdiA-regulated domain-containing protein [Melioribacteraceae bacterium]|nr:SdiA-regulated domain-containing protein [Melioribacteraceae bacterium]MCF8263394.1 SdiA-regulated domain-containing protein [Melioribacteraceae bacterium]MCF8414204.1 SdiA-regulated domain-containing protein [Melioribacteraceae bacterium]MCF8430880.1 SdiA-regulated domain-containing protein [Melioribacteraceae bacterium]